MSKTLDKVREFMSDLDQSVLATDQSGQRQIIDPSRLPEMALKNIITRERAFRGFASWTGDGAVPRSNILIHHLTHGEFIDTEPGSHITSAVITSRDFALQQVSQEYQLQIPFSL